MFDRIKQKTPKKLRGGRQPTSQLRQKRATAAGKLVTFFHPDYTVGPGISPGHAEVIGNITV
jgi:hypothetical protein